MAIWLKGGCSHNMNEQLFQEQMETYVDNALTVYVDHTLHWVPLYCVLPCRI